MAAAIPANHHSPDSNHTGDHAGDHAGFTWSPLERITAMVITAATRHSISSTSSMILNSEQLMLVDPAESGSLVLTSPFPRAPLSSYFWDRIPNLQGVETQELRTSFEIFDGSCLSQSVISSTPGAGDGTVLAVDNLWYCSQIGVHCPAGVRRYADSVSLSNQALFPVGWQITVSRLSERRAICNRSRPAVCGLWEILFHLKEPRVIHRMLAVHLKQTVPIKVAHHHPCYNNSPYGVGDAFE